VVIEGGSVKRGGSKRGSSKEVGVLVCFNQ
jgi:hypothetical protein